MPSQEPASPLAAKSQREELYLFHPSESPDEFFGPLPYLIHPPSRMSSSTSWRRYREETLLPLIASNPDDQNLPLFLACAEEVLSWRAQIEPSERFWKRD